MTPIPEKTPPPETAELVDVVYYLRGRVEQLEETVHDLLMTVDEMSSRQDPERYMEGN